MTPPPNYCPVEENNIRCTSKDVMGTLFLPAVPYEHVWSLTLRGFLYFIALCWFFMGVAIASDIFMGAIEYIVSKSKTVTYPQISP